MSSPSQIAALLTLLLTAILVSPATGQAPEGTMTDPGLQQLVRQLYVAGEFHGGILIAEGEEIILEEAWGLADHQQGQVLTPEHRFATNSMGKMFTAILTMQLVEHGELALDDPLGRHVPAFGHPRAGEVTVHMLLSHRSGLPDYFINQLRGVIPMDMGMPAILETIAGMDLDFEPGTMFHYSNTGYVLLGMIIEGKLGQPFGQVLEERIFEPLGMDDTKHSPEVFGDRVPNYFTEDGRILESAPWFSVGDGAETSSLRDLHRFMLALGSDRLLSEESWNLMFTAHSLPSEVPEGAWPPAHQDPYGYGFTLPSLPYSGDSTALAAGHGGAGLGSNYAVRFLDSGRIVIIWNNMNKRPKRLEIFDYLAGR
jgi:CubicO group peptidase (beta-lactamase class C family)